MSTGTRIPLAEAQAIAGDVISRLRRHCSKREVAGSIRRRRPHYRDDKALKRWLCLWGWTPPPKKSASAQVAAPMVI